jgi:hypothetical protein
MEPARQSSRHLTKKPPPPTSSYATEEEEELEREIAMRDPDLASLIARANSRRQDPSFVHSFNVSKHAMHSVTEEDTSSEGEEEDEEDASIERGTAPTEDEGGGRTVITFPEGVEDDHGYDEEDDPAETEELQDETEDMAEPEDHEQARSRVAPQHNGRNGKYEESRAATERSRGRPVPSRTPSYEQASDDDQTEGGSTQDEDEESVYSDAPEEEEEEFPTDPLVIEELEKFQATFRGIEKRFRLINKIGEGALPITCLCDPCPCICSRGLIVPWQGHSARCTKQKISCTIGSTIAGTSTRPPPDEQALVLLNMLPSRRYMSPVLQHGYRTS